ncbi:MAG: hypothetical protein JW772_03610 [Candidatus Diapherotrites archaeon]|nr:hypothetical protein [Candidatus Diapherotrites archaeon]
MKAIFLILILILFFLFGCISPTTGDVVVGTLELEGIVRQGSWEKSLKSYCAGGSDFFVLETESGEEKVLKYDAMLYDYTDKRVAIKASEIERTIPCPQGSQCPVPKDWKAGTPEPSFVCTVFEVTEITTIK